VGRREFADVSLGLKTRSIPEDACSSKWGDHGRGESQETRESDPSTDTWIETGSSNIGARKEAGLCSCPARNTGLTMARAGINEILVLLAD
jgi:hypothetical protein